MARINDDIIKDISLPSGIEAEDFKTIIEKSLITNEINSEDDIKNWFKNRFLPNLVFIDSKDYAQMCFHSLKIIKTTTPTDYGSSRQRDFGQIWADITRGYLGEVAFAKMAKEKYGIQINLGHARGTLEEYLPSDILSITKNGITKEANFNVSIKTTKFNGIWLDIPGAQFTHSDYYILVKIAIARDHLFSFFKEISVFKDKILQYGIDRQILSNKESNDLYQGIPNIKNIPAYITGFLKAKNFRNKNPIYKGKPGNKHYNVCSWAGQINDETFKAILDEHHLNGNVKFNGIGSFSHSHGYIFSSDHFEYKRNSWDNFFERL